MIANISTKVAPVAVQVELSDRKGTSMRVLCDYLGEAFFEELERLIRQGGYGEMNVSIKPAAPITLTVTQSIRGVVKQPTYRSPAEVRAARAERYYGKPKKE